MEDKSINSCLRHLSEINLKEFKMPILQTDSKEEILKKIVEVINYFRKVLLVFNLVTQTIQARSALLTGRYNFCKESMTSVETVMNDVTENLYSITKKYAKANDKNKELVVRSRNALERVIGKQNDMNEAEKDLGGHFQLINDRIILLRSDFDHAKLKRKAIKTFEEEQLKQCHKAVYLQDFHISLIKENIKNISIGIQSLLREISAIRRILYKD